MKLRFLFLSLAVFAAIFSGMIVGALVVVRMDPRNVHPPESADLAKLKDKLIQNPDDPTLKSLFTSLDHDNRAYVLTRARLTRTGGYLLVITVAVFLISSWFYLRTDPHPVRLPVRTSYRSPKTSSIIALASIALLIIIAAFYAASLKPLDLSPTPPPFPAPESVAVPEPSPAPSSPFHQSWPGFRGPNGLALAPPGDYPTSWDLDKRENILWSSDVPLPGKSSPIVWGDRLFLTGASPASQSLFCFDRSTGKLLWTTPISTPDSLAWAAGPKDSRVQIGAETGQAASTPATDGSFVFALFNTNDLAAVDFSGKIKWVVNLGKPDSTYGLASSPILYKDALIYQCDQGSHAEDNLSALLAIDKLTGRVLWRTPRPVQSSWSSPILAKTSTRDELITTATTLAIAYDPATGRELWRANVLGSSSADVGSSAAYADGIAFTTDDESQLSAIRTGGAGDVTAANVLWHSAEGLPDVSSPVCDGRFLFQADSIGLITCFEPKTGKLFWSKQFPKEFWSSPIIANGLLYASDHTGRTFIIKLGETFDQVSTCHLSESIDSTPAFADSTIYFRTDKHLIAIAKKPTP